MATCSSFLAWKILWTEKPGGYKPWGCKESIITECERTHTHTFYLLFLLSLQCLLENGRANQCINSVFTAIYAVTNNCKLSGLKQHSSGGQESKMSHGQDQELAELPFFWRLQETTHVLPVPDSRATFIPWLLNPCPPDLPPPSHKDPRDCIGPL